MTSVIVWMFVCPQYSYIESLTPNMMVLGGEAVGRQFVHEDRTLMNEISVL